MAMTEKDWLDELAAEENSAEEMSEDELEEAQAAMLENAMSEFCGEYSGGVDLESDEEESNQEESDQKPKQPESNEQEQDKEESSKTPQSQEIKSPSEAKTLEEITSKIDELISKMEESEKELERIQKLTMLNQAKIKDLNDWSKVQGNVVAERIIDGSLASFKETQEKYTTAIGGITKEAISQIESLEKESLERNKRFMSRMMPSKIYSYIKYLLIIFAFVLAAAWIIEKFV